MRHLSPIVAKYVHHHDHEKTVKRLTQYTNDKLSPWCPRATVDAFDHCPRTTLFQTQTNIMLRFNSAHNRSSASHKGGVSTNNFSRQMRDYFRAPCAVIKYPNIESFPCATRRKKKHKKFKGALYTQCSHVSKCQPITWSLANPNVRPWCTLY